MGLPTKLKPGEEWTCPDHLCERKHQLPQLLQHRDQSHTCTCGLATIWRRDGEGFTCINAERAPDAVHKPT